MITLLILVGAVFLLTITSNVMALNSIDSNNYALNVYLELANAKSEASTAFQQMQLYANLSYFKKDTDEFETMKTKLQKAIDDTNAAMDQMLEVNNLLGNEAMLSAYQTWYDAMAGYTDYCSVILQNVTNEDFDTAKAMIDDNVNYKTPVQDAEDAYDVVLAEQQEITQSMSNTKFESTSFIV